VRQILLATGFSEASTFAFVEQEAAAPFSDPGTDPVPIANPLSEKFAVLRPSLLVGLVDSASHNRRRGRKDIQLFEAGSRFGSAGEGRAAAFVWSGAAEGPHWSAPTRSVDFFDAKGIAEAFSFPAAPPTSASAMRRLASWARSRRRSSKRAEFPVASRCTRPSSI
jgi:phenylalanyl-tRNA synthetase beta chain